MDKNSKKIIWDGVFISVSIGFAIIIIATGVLEQFIIAIKDIRFIGSFLAGILFTSVFSAIPATAVLGELARLNSPVETAIIGGLGAMAGDYLIFHLFKGRIYDDFSYFIKISKSDKFLSIFRLRLFRRLYPFIGALIIASPLPDEIGLAMMGLAKVRNSVFIPLSFLLNAGGILIIGIIARAI